MDFRPGHRRGSRARPHRWHNGTPSHSVSVWHGHHKSHILRSAGANFHCRPPSESSKMAPLLPHTVPLAAMLPCIYVTMGGGATGHSPPENRTLVPPSGPVVARPVDPHPHPAPKPGARGTPHHTRCRHTIGGTRPPSIRHPLLQGGRMTTPAFPNPAAGLSARGRLHASRTHRSGMSRHVTICH